MKTFLIYISGVATPFIVALVCSLLCELGDWRARRRYQRAWDKFGAEFDALTEPQLTLAKIRWDAEPWTYKQICDDRSRYFTMRWQYGRTKEV